MKVLVLVEEKMKVLEKKMQISSTSEDHFTMIMNCLTCLWQTVNVGNQCGL